MSDLLDTSKIAYCAGIIDGEGCIFIPKSKGSVNLKVTMGHKEAVWFLRNTFNRGTVQVQEARGYNMAWSWLCTTLDCIAVLRQVRPYLIVKMVEAEIAFEFVAIPKPHMGHGRNHRGPRLSPEVLAAREDCWDRMRRAKPSFVFRE